MPPKATVPAPPHPTTKIKELYVWVEPIRKLYTNDMGRFPVGSRSGNYFIMLAYYVDSNIILVEPFQSRHNRHRLAAANRIISRLQKNGHNVDLQILDNEYSTTYKLKIEENGSQNSNSFPPTCTTATQPNE